MRLNPPESIEILAAYNATDPQDNWCEDWAQVFTDTGAGTGAGQPLPANHPLTAQRPQIETQILENLLRLNHERAST